MALPWNIDLTSEQQLQLETLDRWVKKKNLETLALSSNEAEEYSVDFHREAGELGLLGQFLPDAYGGTENSTDETLRALTVMRLSEDIPEWYMSLSASAYLTGWQIASAGTEVQKQFYLPGLASGEKIGSFALTESTGGSNSLFYGKTTLEEKEDHFLLNGEKTFITNGCHADYIYVFCRDSRFQEGDPMGVRSVMVHSTDKGFAANPMKGKSSMRGSNTATVFFEDVHLPKDRLVFGREGLSPFQIRHIAEKNLLRERIGAFYMSVGIGRGVLRRLHRDIGYEGKTMRRPKGEKHIIAFPNVELRVQELNCRVEEKQKLALAYAKDIDEIGDWNALQHDSLPPLYNRLMRGLTFQKKDTTKVIGHIAKDAKLLAGGMGQMLESHYPRLEAAVDLLAVGGGTAQIMENILRGLQKGYYK